MGAHQSKEELLYQQINYGNIEGIKALRRDGAGLEWIDKEGKTPLMLACMRPDLLNVAKVLIELGANVNAYRPGSHAGTPLHHAAKRGLDQTVNLLLSNGANPLVMNDNCQTPLDLARVKGHCNVVRAIEGRICLFCGWLRELYGPSILEALAPQWVQRKIWAVVLPCDSRNPMAPHKFELAIYPDLQVAQPRVAIALEKVYIEEPKFNQSDPSLVIVDKTSSKYDLLPYGLRTRARSLCGGQSYKLNHPHHLMHPNKPVSPSDKAFAAAILDASNIPKEAKSGKNGKKLPNLRHFETRYKFLSAYEGDKQQLQWLYNACRGISQQNSYVPVAPLGAAPTPNSSHQNSNTPATSVPPHAPFPEDVQLAMAINASIQSALAEGVPVPNAQPVNLTANTNGWGPSLENTSYNGWAQSSGAPPPSKLEPAPDPFNGWSGVRPSSSSPQLHTSQLETPTVLPSVHEAPPTVSVPSAPPIVDETFYAGPIQYPTIDASPVDLTVPAAGSKPEPVDPNEGGSGGAASSSCVICLDAPVEGACIPCGHMAGCMSCLNEIKGKNWGCPVCRAKIDQIIRLYAV